MRTNIQPPLMIPQDAFNIQGRVVSVAAWNTQKNITSSNNQVLVTTADRGTVTIQLLPGQYDVTGFGVAVSQGLVAQGLPSDTVSVFGDTYTQTVFLTTAHAPVTVTIPGTGPYPLLGTPTGYSFNLAENAVAYYAPFRAEFNTVNSWRLACDLLGPGLSIGGEYNGTVAQVPIAAPPGFQNLFQPPYPITIPADSLKGAIRNEFVSSLTDEVGDPVYTGEPWEFVLEVMWEHPERETMHVIRSRL